MSVLLLDPDGRVRSDADFLFCNNPAADEGSVQLLGRTPTDNGSEDRIGLDLTAIPAAVERGCRRPPVRPVPSTPRVR